MVKGAEYLCLNLISDYSKIKRINHERIPIARRSTLLVRLFFIKLIILLLYKSKGSRGLVVRALTYPDGRSSQLSWGQQQMGRSDFETWGYSKFKLFFCAVYDENTLLVLV